MKFDCSIITFIYCTTFSLHCSYDNFDVALPFGGFKKSGFGKDKSVYALESYSEAKTVCMPIAGYDWR